ncbi:MAG: hypothetical protein QW666_00200 [Candidatus Woesearchaeota archaeon]
MALESIPNIIEVYNYAPWLFDGAVICLVLGLLFRLLFKKAKLGKEEESEKLGGIVGFVIGLIIVIGMQTKGMHLIDLWSWLVLAIIILGAILLRNWLIETFGKEHSWIITVFVIILSIFIAGALLGSMPGFTAITIGTWGEGLMRWIMYLALIGLIMFGLSRIPFRKGKGGGGGEEGGGEEGEGWWPWRRKKKPKTPEEEEKEVEKEEEDAKKEKEDADKKTDDADKETEETIEEAKNLKKIKDQARDNIVKIESSIESARVEDTIKNAEEYHDLVVNYKKVINTAYKELMERRAVEEFDTCHRVHDKLIEKVKLFIGGMRTYLDTIKNLKKQISDIEDAASKGRLETEREGYEKEVSDIHAEMTTALKKFEDDTKEAINDAQTKAAEKAIAAVVDAKEKLDTAMDTLGVSLNDLARITATDPNLDEIINKIKTGIAAALQKFEILNEKIKDLISQLEYIKSALEAMKNALKNDIGKALDYARAKYEAIKEKIERMTEELAEILSGEYAARKVRVEELREIEDIIATVEMQKQLLKKLIENTRNFIRTLINVFTKELTEDEQIQIRGIIEARFGGKQAEVSINTAKKAYQTLPKEITKAEEIVKGKIPLALGFIAEEFADVAQNKNSVDTAIREITNAANQLKLRLDTGAGITIQQRPKLQALYNNLLNFLKSEQKIKEVLSNYEEFVLNIIRTHLQEVAQGKKKSSNVKTILDYASKTLNDLEKLLDLLNTEEIIIRRGAEEAEIPSTSRRRTVPSAPIPPVS